MQQVSETRRRTRLGTTVGMIAFFVLSALAVAACGGSTSSADGPGPTATAGATTAPQVFKSVNATMTAAINAAEPKLGQASQPAGAYTAIGTQMRQALEQWQSTGVLPASTDVESVTAAIETLVADFNAPTVNTEKASTDIGAYMAAALRYTQGEHVT